MGRGREGKICLCLSRHFSLSSFSLSLSVFPSSCPSPFSLFLSFPYHALPLPLSHLLRPSPLTFFLSSSSPSHYSVTLHSLYSASPSRSPPNSFFLFLFRYSFLILPPLFVTFSLASFSLSPFSFPHLFFLSFSFFSVSLSYFFHSPPLSPVTVSFTCSHSLLPSSFLSPSPILSFPVSYHHLQFSPSSHHFL